MEWKTAIGDEKVLRGYNRMDLIGKLSFSEAIYLLLNGELAGEKEAKMMDAIFVSCIDHGIAPPSVVAARTVFSASGSLNTAVGAGVGSLGEHHGGALESAAKFFQENANNDAASVVKGVLARNERLGGYGHKLYKEDPRTVKLFDIAKKLGFFGKYAEFALDVESELEKQKGKKLCLNVDGAIAAIISEMGFDWRLGKGFFIIARTPGLVAHVHEEWCNEKPFRRLTEYSYTGEKERSIN